MSVDPRGVPEPEASEAVTRGVRVTVAAEFAPKQSLPSHERWHFRYTVRIANESNETVQLISRHWIITDATGQIEEIKGLGVVGQQPVLEKGEAFEYTSSCPLSTPFGSMRGTYQLVTGSGERFDTEIAPFALRAPYTIH